MTIALSVIINCRCYEDACSLYYSFRAGLRLVRIFLNLIMFQISYGNGLDCSKDAYKVIMLVQLVM